MRLKDPLANSMAVRERLGRLIREIIADSTAMIQPFAPEILAEGEWSLMFFGNGFSHAVKKQPKRGDFRVQFTHGGRHCRATPPTAVLIAATNVMRLLDEREPPRLFTRVDGVVQDGAFKLIEVEMIEPFLFFAEDPAAPGRFAEALWRRLTALGQTLPAALP